MRIVLIILLLCSCAEKKRDLRGKVLTRKDDVVMAGEDTLNVSERIRYNIYSLEIGDTLK